MNWWKLNKISSWSAQMILLLQDVPPAPANFLMPIHFPFTLSLIYRRKAEHPFFWNQILCIFSQLWLIIYESWKKLKWDKTVRMIIWAYRFTMTIPLFSRIIQTIHMFITVGSTQIRFWCFKWAKCCTNSRLKILLIHIIPLGASLISTVAGFGISWNFWIQIGRGKVRNNNSSNEFNVSI